MAQEVSYETDNCAVHITIALEILFVKHIIHNGQSMSMKRTKERSSVSAKITKVVVSHLKHCLVLQHRSSGGRTAERFSCCWRGNLRTSSSKDGPK